MREFLVTLSRMYNTSYSNILLLKNQKENVSFVVDKESMKKYKLHLKEGEEPLKAIKRIQIDGKVNFKIGEVFDVSQTDATKKKEKTYSKEYVETILKGMCTRRGLTFVSNNPMENIENIIVNIRDNSRPGNASSYNVEEYASQTQSEVEATIFAIAKKLNVNTRNYNLKDICKWGIDKELSVLKESLRYIQKYTNYFVKDFQKQEKLYQIENEKQEDEELE